MGSGGAPRTFLNDGGATVNDRKFLIEIEPPALNSGTERRVYELI